MRLFLFGMVVVSVFQVAWAIEPTWTTGQMSPYEELLAPQRVAQLFGSEREVRDFLRTNRTAFGYYQAGVFYLYHAYGMINTLNISRREARSITRRAIEALERARRLEQNEPMVFSMLGGAYLFSSQWGSAGDRMRNGRRGVFYTDKSVIMAPDNLRVRESRLRSYVNLPPEWFPNVLRSIPEDARMLLSAVERYAPLHPEFAAYAEEVRSLCYFGKGLVAFHQRDEAKAGKYLQRVGKESGFYPRAEAFLKRLGD